MNKKQRRFSWYSLILSMSFIVMILTSPFAVSAAEVPVDTVELSIKNTVMDRTDGAPWEGELTDSYGSNTVPFVEGMTVKDALDTYATAHLIPVDGNFPNGGSGYFLEGIDGLTNKHQPADAIWSAWTYTVNGEEVYDAMNQRVLQAGDSIDFIFTVGYPNITVEIQNNTLTKDLGAPWVGTLASGDFYYSLPMNENVTALEVLKTFDQFNDNVTVKTKTSEWGEFVSDINGLHDEMVIPNYKWPGWLFYVNGEMPTEGMSTYIMQPGDVLTIDFAITEDIQETTTTTTAATTTTTTSTSTSTQTTTTTVDPTPTPTSTTTATSTTSTTSTTSETSTTSTTSETSPDLPVADAYWPSFRGNELNNANRYLAYRSPRSPEEANLLWDKSFPNSDFMGVPSQMILVNNSLVFVQRDTLYALNPQTGDVLRSQALVSSQGYASTAPLYKDGIIYVPLDGGRVQALRADTWETLWTYRDPLGGQSQSPLFAQDGVVYAGFWQTGTEQALVALSSVDGSPIWRNTTASGYYFAGGLVYGNYYVTGSEQAGIQVFDKTTGQKTDSMPTSSFVRSSIVRDGDVFYAIENNGLLHAFQITAAGEINQVYSVAIGNAVTATPTIANGKIFIASNGSLYVLNQYSGEVIQRVQIDGYSQGSPLILVDGAYVHVYFVLNQMPGGINHWTDADGSTSAELLYAPDDANKQNYSLASPIVGPDGVIYYRNDSGTLFALERKVIETTTTTSSEPIEESSSTLTEETTASSLTEESSSEVGETILETTDVTDNTTEAEVSASIEESVQETDETLSNGEYQQRDHDHSEVNVREHAVAATGENSRQEYAILAVILGGIVIAYRLIRKSREMQEEK